MSSAAVGSIISTASPQYVIVTIRPASQLPRVTYHGDGSRKSVVCGDTVAHATSHHLFITCLARAPGPKQVFATN
jgi:hypothetical protein